MSFEGNSYKGRLCRLEHLAQLYLVTPTGTVRALVSLDTIE